MGSQSRTTARTSSSTSVSSVTRVARAAGSACRSASTRIQASTMSCSSAEAAGTRSRRPPSSSRRAANRGWATEWIPLPSRVRAAVTLSTRNGMSSVTTSTVVCSGPAPEADPSTARTTARPGGRRSPAVRCEATAAVRSSVERSASSPDASEADHSWSSSSVVAAERRRGAEGSGALSRGCGVGGHGRRRHRRLLLDGGAVSGCGVTGRGADPERAETTAAAGSVPNGPAGWRPWQPSALSAHVRVAVVGGRHEALLDRAG